jgi:GH43 family beta-xylosidase
MLEILLDGSRPMVAAAGFAVLSIAACGGGGGGGGTPPVIEPPASCTFTNPLVTGADPWVVKQGDSYYFAQSINNGIWISKATTLTGVFTAPPVKIWAPADTGWNRTNLWAPELHFADGRWYVYYAAGAAGPPFTSQHAGVLQSADANAQGAYADKGMLYTGDSLGTGTGNRWSIDLTTTQIGTQRYAIWSGWANNATTDKTPQQLYIARMDNPWTIASNRVMISAPTAAWERGTELDLQEGPEVLQRGSDVFLIYSTRESWLVDYKLGQLRLASGADPMLASSWTKSGPVFTGNAGVYGVGHASFTTSPNGAENWIVYHSKIATTPGWERNVRMQRFTFGASGEPVFGEAVAAGTPTARPAGECP